MTTESLLVYVLYRYMYTYTSRDSNWYGLRPNTREIESLLVSGLDMESLLVSRTSILVIPILVEIPTRSGSASQGERVTRWVASSAAKSFRVAGASENFFERDMREEELEEVLVVIGGELDALRADLSLQAEVIIALSRELEIANGEIDYLKKKNSKREGSLGRQVVVPAIEDWWNDNGEEIEPPRR